MKYLNRIADALKLTSVVAFSSLLSLLVLASVVPLPFSSWSVDTGIGDILAGNIGLALALIAIGGRILEVVIRIINQSDVRSKTSNVIKKFLQSPSHLATLILAIPLLNIVVTIF